jgi:prepilin-type N-terminal cleavage/methylation domain-containing protein
MGGSQLRVRNGFTLTEVLVVLGIIAALVAIAFPVLNSARARAQEAKCMSNLRQLGIAISLYRANEGSDVPYGTPTKMGLPPTISRIPQTTAIQSCPGVRPFNCTPSGGYSQQWPTNLPQFFSEESAQAWARYVEKHQDEAILIVDEGHPFACPVSPYSRQRLTGLYLGGHVKRVIKFGSPAEWEWWN